jgi:hypothetical protein
MLWRGLVALFVLVLPASAIPVPEDWYPAQVGTTWTYRRVEDGKQVVVRVTSCEEQRGVLYVCFETNWASDLTVKEWYALRKDGVWRFKLMGDPIEPRLCILQLPPETGDCWKSHILHSAVPNEIMAVHKTKLEAVQVLAGAYPDAAKVEMVITEPQILGTSTVWYAPNVGMVKMVSQSNGRTTTLELVKVQFPGR